MLDGDSLEKLTADGVDTEAYRDVYDTLDSFRQTIDLSYIYSVRQLDDEPFVFTVDPGHEQIKTAVSKGWSEFRPGEDNDYRPVFRRADEAMYHDKSEYYRVHPDRRSR